MKKLLYILCGLVLAFASCSKEEEVFEQSSSERMSLQIEKYTELLVSSEYGWKMQYFPDPRRLGGYNFFFEFENNGQVKMATDFRDGIQKSTFSFNGGQGVVLNFDTYNYLHVLADPGYFPAGTGYRGDFELIVERASADSIICKGRKWKQPMVLTKATAADWDNRNKIVENEKTLAPFQKDVPFFRNVRVDGEGIATFLYTPNNRFVEYFYKDEASGETKSGQTGVIFTSKGFRLYKDLEINNVVLRDFVYDSESSLYVFGDNGTLTMEHESAIEFENAWDELYQTDGGSLYMTSQDFRTLFDEAKELEPELATLQFYWNIKNYRLFSFVFLKEADDVYVPRWYHSLIGNIQSPGEDCAIFEAARDQSSGKKVIIPDANGSEDELNHLFFSDTPSSTKFNEILDIIYNPKGFTIIPTSEGMFYMISKTRSNYWLLIKPF